MKIVRHYDVEFTSPKQHTLTVSFVGSQIEAFDFALVQLYDMKFHDKCNVYRRHGDFLIQFTRVEAELLHELA